MRGVLMTEFLGWIEQTRGIAEVDAIITELGDALTDGGAYTAVGDYPHDDLMRMMRVVAAREAVTEFELQRQFGTALFPTLANVGAPMLEGVTGSRDVFARINDVIHVEVKKLYPESHPPSVTMEQVDANEAFIQYSSHRDMAALCLGLVEGALDFYEESAEVTMSGEGLDSDNARIRIRWSAGD
jgi:hypothetical protein